MSNSKMRNISKEGSNSWKVRKHINGKTYSFGNYPSLEKAIEMRDYFESKGWENCLDERLEASHKKKQLRNIVKERQFNSWCVRKWINGKNYCFGNYTSLERAIEMRDYFESKGWENCLDERLSFTDIKNYRKKKSGKYQITKMIDGEMVVMMDVRTLEDAKKEVELLRKCNWDLEAACEGIDDTDDGEIRFLDGVKGWGNIKFQTHKNGRQDWI